MGQMQTDYTLYTLPASMYSGKVRGYMNYKKLDYVDKTTDIFDAFVRVKKNTGEVVVPVVQSRNGQWLQDTTVIIEELEKKHKERSIGVETPIQAMVSLLLEAWGDEFWLPTAMHYRWSYPEEQLAGLSQESGDWFFPFLPKFVRSKLGLRMTRRLVSAAPFVGFNKSQHAVLEAWTENMLDLLEQHFSHHDYVLGGRPTIADYSLLASFFGHLNRDPVPKRVLMAPRPNLTAWVLRTHHGDDARSDLPADDMIPETLMPVVQSVCDEFLPMIGSYRDGLVSFIEEKGLSSGDALPRFVKRAEFPMVDGWFRRSIMPYSLWMMQRVQRKLLERSTDEQSKVEAWFDQHFGQSIAKLDLGPTLIRKGLSTAIA